MQSFAEAGRLDLSSPAQLEGLCPDWRERAAYACGPAGFLDDAEALWRREAAADLTIERFQADFAPGVAGAGGRVVFEHADVEVDAPGDVPLLVVAEDAGVAAPAGCRMGICHACLTPLRSGQVTDLRRAFLGASSFNQAIGGWNVGAVELMEKTFEGATSFNQDIGGWSIGRVTSIKRVFYGATSFDQDLGWCVDDDVDVDRSFFDTACESTSCGVKIGDCTACAGGWVQALSYDSKDCPEDADGSIFPNCQQVACGELCEGDGECGTDTQLNNCPSKDYGRRSMMPRSRAIWSSP